MRDVTLEAATALDPAGLDVHVVREGAQGQPVTVTVVYRAVSASPIAGWLMPEAVDLTAAASMRQEVG